ncbi:DUF6778 family protein [Roseobacter sp.]|uniref:DUF6778 family protein n=1 Tax=Roseobacter sp. TaxID=1907202 RepID=UPI003858AD32
MNRTRLIMASVLAALVSGCGFVDSVRWANVDDRSPLSNPTHQQNLLAAPDDIQHRSFDVTRVIVSVPRSLKVSESNRFYPPGDIVWRGDPAGDRHEQVKAIFDAAIGQGVASMTDGVPVDLYIEVQRFHSLTERARYSIGGVHSITFILSLKEANTGVLLETPRQVKANLNALGGKRAIDADRKGQTQKARITAHLAAVIQSELKALNGKDHS